MKYRCTLAFIVIAQIAWSSPVFAQAFGEYGRAVGSIPRGKGVTGGAPSLGGDRGSISSGNIGDSGARSMPTRLVVTVKDAGLFPRQDDNTEKLSQLTEGESLLPMVQSEGSNPWFMVRTQKGLVGWVKASDVRQEKAVK